MHMILDVPNPTLASPNDGSSEKQYLTLAAQCIRWGHQRPDRTGTGTRALHGATMRFDLSDGTIPLPTTKTLNWQTPAVEMLWFLAGDSNIRTLLRQGVHIWSQWPHQRFIKATGEDVTLKAFEQRVLDDDAFAKAWGSIGPGYGVQWRRWQGPDGRTYDQLADLIERLRRDPYSRRLLFHGWNVADIDDMALPPCHLLYQFFVADGRLSLTLYQRSADVGLGLPFNLVGAAILLRLVAQQCDLLPGQLLWVGHDVHVYNNHIDGLTEQLARTPQPAPHFELLGRAPSLFDYTLQHMAVSGYDPAPRIVLPVAV